MNSIIFRTTLLCLSMNLTSCKVNKLIEAVKEGQEAEEAESAQKAALGKGSDGTGDDSTQNEDDPTETDGEQGKDDPTQNEDDDVIVIGPGEEGDEDVVVNPPEEEGEDEETPTEPEVPGDVTGGKVVVRTPTAEDEKIIAGCSKALGMEMPLANGRVRTIVASVGLLGSGTPLRDERVTEEPEMTIVMASVNILGGMRWQLMNPNGLYCIVANVNILSNLTIEISETAQLADGSMGVNILSAANGNSAAIGTNILSKVEIIQK